MMNERTVEINGVIYHLPENVKWQDGKGLVDEYGQKVETNYAPPNRGYLEIPDIGRIKKHVYLDPVDGQEEFRSAVKPGLAWDLSIKLVSTIIVDGKLVDDYEQRLQEIKKQLEENGDVELRDYMLDRINATIKKFKKDGVIDFTSVNKSK